MPSRADAGNARRVGGEKDGVRELRPQCLQHQKLVMHVGAEHADRAQALAVAAPFAQAPVKRAHLYGQAAQVVELTHPLGNFDEGTVAAAVFVHAVRARLAGRGFGAFSADVCRVAVRAPHVGERVCAEPRVLVRGTELAQGSAIESVPFGDDGDVAGRHFGRGTRLGDTRLLSPAIELERAVHAAQAVR